MRSCRLPVSTEIVNYNAGRFLLGRIRAALPPVNETLVVVNASTDSCLELCVQNFPDEPKLRVIRNDANLEFAPAFNIGAKYARGDDRLFLNPDCSLFGRSFCNVAGK